MSSESTPPLAPLWADHADDNIIDAVVGAKPKRKPGGGYAWAYLLRFAGNDDAHEDWQWAADIPRQVLARFWRSIDPDSTHASGRYPPGWTVIPKQSYIDWGIINAALCEKQALLDRYGAFDTEAYKDLLRSRTDFSLLGSHASLPLASANARRRPTRPSKHAIPHRDPWHGLLAVHYATTPPTQQQHDSPRHPVDVARYAGHPVLQHKPSSCTDLHIHELRRRFKYVDLDERQSIVTVTAHFSSCLHPFEATSALRLHAQPLSFLDEHLNAVCLMMPSLKDFHVRIPCHPNTRRSPDDYVRAFQWIDQFLQSYTGR
ncbi:hypothetical protein AURDEDRAFT_178604, partial [Auricularia subglabra TFB-10046 SS5]